MFGAAGARRLRDRAPYAGRNNRRPYSQHPLRCPVPRSFCILQVFIAFAVIFCPLLVGRPRDHVRRGWGVPLCDHPPLCRAQHPEKGSGHVAAGYALRNILRKVVACGGRYALRNILRKAVGMWRQVRMFRAVFSLSPQKIFLLRRPVQEGCLWGRDSTEARF